MHHLYIKVGNNLYYFNAARIGIVLIDDETVHGIEVTGQGIHHASCKQLDGRPQNVETWMHDKTLNIYGCDVTCINAVREGGEIRA
jgi:hypothetical protein